LSQLLLPSYAGFFRNAQQQYYLPLGYNKGPALNLSDADSLHRQQVLGMDHHSVQFEARGLMPVNMTVDPAAVQQLVDVFQGLAANNMVGTLFLGNGAEPAKPGEFGSHVRDS
jgi:hypothetical protein